MGRVNGRRCSAAVVSGCLFSAAVLVAGCSSDQVHEYRAQSDRVTAGAGDAMASNRAVHTIDPWPYDSQNTRIDIDGKRVQTAVRRYETNAKSKAPDNGQDTNGR